MFHKIVYDIWEENNNEKRPLGYSWIWIINQKKKEVYIINNLNKNTIAMISRLSIKQSHLCKSSLFSGVSLLLSAVYTHSLTHSVCLVVSLLAMWLVPLFTLAAISPILSLSIWQRTKIHCQWHKKYGLCNWWR